MITGDAGVGAGGVFAGGIQVAQAVRFGLGRRGGGASSCVGGGAGVWWPPVRWRGGGGPCVGLVWGAGTRTRD